MGAGLTAPSASTTALPQPGIAGHPVGMLDVMTGEGANGDSGIFARIFYPAEPDAATFDVLTRDDDDHLPYWIERKEYVAGMLAQLKNVSKRGQWLAEWIIGERRIRCVRKAALATPDTIRCRLPVIIFSHGVGESRHQHSSLCAALASYGYVVAAIEHRDYSACWTFKLQQESAVASSSSIRGRTGRTEKPMTFLDVGEVDSKRENKTRNQQVHKRVAECVRLLHFLEECDLGLINRCTCCPSTSSSSSSACSSDTTSMYSFSSEESAARRRSRPRESSSCRLSLHSDCKEGDASRLLMGEDYEWAQFAERLDLSSAVIMGVGLGAATALACCSFTTDFQKAIGLDATLRPLDTDVYTRVVQPILFLNRPGGASPETQGKFEDAESITLMDAEAHTFSDLPLLLRPVLGRRLRLNGATDADQMAETVVRVCAAFLQARPALEEYGTDRLSIAPELPSPGSVKNFLLEQNYSCNPFPPLTPVSDETEIFL